MRPHSRRVSLGSVLSILSAVAVAFVLPACAYADSVPAALIEVAAAGGTTILTAGTVSGTGFNGGAEGGSSSSTASASFDGLNASVSGSGSTSGGVATANSSGLAEVTFYFEVQGSATGVTSVPLIFTGSGSTSASGPDAEALAYFETPGGQLYSCSATGGAVGACGSEPASNSGTIDYSAAVGGLYDMQVIASGDSTLGSGNWSASVDPEVMIDPSFADAADFTLVLSPGVPGGTTTPEPSSLLLLATGLSGLVTLARRKLLA